MITKFALRLISLFNRDNFVDKKLLIRVQIPGICRSHLLSRFLVTSNVTIQNMTDTYISNSTCASSNLLRKFVIKEKDYYVNCTPISIR